MSLLAIKKLRIYQVEAKKGPFTIQRSDKIGYIILATVVVCVLPKIIIVDLCQWRSCIIKAIEIMNLKGIMSILK